MLRRWRNARAVRQAIELERQTLVGVESSWCGCTFIATAHTEGMRLVVDHVPVERCDQHRRVE